ncbi:hypothetical protein, partial [Nocardia cerradoensis]|uniref:hypothetical protein n=1 Tax=Nocardia cerradoensis TaxID=85688 RepID=UPI001CB91B87
CELRRSPPVVATDGGERRFSDRSARSNPERKERVRTRAARVNSAYGSAGNGARRRIVGARAPTGVLAFDRKDMRWLTPPMWC